MFRPTRLLISLTAALCCHLVFGASKNGVYYKQYYFSQLPGWKIAHPEYSFPAIKGSCKQLIAHRKKVGRTHDPRYSRAWQKTCQAILNTPEDISQKAAKQFLAKWFVPYQMQKGGKSTGLFTGYYEPTMLGSLKRTDYFKVPIYGKPRSMRRVTTRHGARQTQIKINGKYVPMPKRAQIVKGRMLPNTPVIAWVHSHVERFFLQIQGSGSIITPSGRKILLGYASQNGHPYFPIGRYLADSGKIPRENVSMQSIKDWLYEHPKEQHRVMNMDDSFVFFRKLDSIQPVGAQTIPLYPRYSLAVDRRYIRLGTPVWLSTSLPKKSGEKIVQGYPWQNLMVAQDTGGAIKGAIRGDVFWGSGERAKWLAGHMQQPGKLWVILPKGVKPTS